MSGWSPRQQVSSASADRDLDREVEQIARVLDEAGPTTAHHLADLLAAKGALSLRRYWRKKAGEKVK